MHEDSIGLGIGRRELSLGGAEADVRTAVLQASLLAEHGVVSLGVRSEAPEHERHAHTMTEREKNKKG